MNRILTPLAFALLFSACISTRNEGLESNQRVLLERSTEDGGELSYTLETTSNGVPQIVRTRTETDEIASLGLRVLSIDNQRSASTGLTPWRGVLVERVSASSAAARAGILPGDVLLSLGGTELSNAEQLADVVKTELEPDSEVEATLLQIAPDKSYPVSSTTTSVKLGASEVTISKSDAFPLDADEGVFRLTGLQLGSVPTELSAEIFADPEPAILVAGSVVGSPAYLAGLRAGDRVLRCDGEAVRSHQDVSRALLARTGDLEIPASWFDASSRRDLTEAKGKIELEVDGPLGTHTAQLDWVKDLEDRFSAHFPILYHYDSDVDSTRWSFLDFIFQFGANYHGRYRESETRAPRTSWLFSMLPLGMFEFEKTRNYTRYCFFWLIEFKDHH